MQGLVCGFVGGDPSALTARRVGDPFAALITSLGAKCWGNARDGGAHLSLTGSLIDSAIDLSGASNSPAGAGAARPSYSSGAFGGRGGMVFAGAQRLDTGSFSMGAAVSGSLYASFTGSSMAALNFGSSIHRYLDIFSFSGIILRRSTLAGSIDDVTIAGTPPYTMRVTWRATQSGMRLLVNGAEATKGAFAGPEAQSSTLTIGTLKGTFPLTGTVGEVIFADASWSDAQMNAVDAAMAARWS